LIIVISRVIGVIHIIVWSLIIADIIIIIMITIASLSVIFKSSMKIV